MTLTQIEKARTEAKDKLKAATEANRNAERALQWEINELNRQEKMALDGVDLTKIQLGEHVLSVDMRESLRGDDRAEIADAITDLTKGAPTLKREYFATKNYDRWDHQGIGSCHYGYGPSHGSVVFSIGLSDALLGKNERDLTADEIEAAIYLLKMLEAGKYLTPAMMKKLA